jgi:lipid II:glycine glycyltransferase (peptidoglycan interpeptide bridge formation enzyme)
MVLKDNKLISAGLVIKFENQLTYYFGASDYEYRQLMPNHFLQYNIINWGIENGFSEYDLWGISPKDSTDHTWLGFTKFKLQLGGKVKSYIGAYDLVLDQSKYKEYAKIIQRTQD